MIGRLWPPRPRQPGPAHLEKSLPLSRHIDGVSRRPGAGRAVGATVRCRTVVSAVGRLPLLSAPSCPRPDSPARPCPPFVGSNPQHPFCPSCPSPLKLQARARGRIHESFIVGAQRPWYSQRSGDGAGLPRTERQDYEQADGTINISCYASWFLFSYYAASIVLAVRSPGFRPGGGGHGSRSMDRQRRGPAHAHGR